MSLIPFDFPVRDGFRAIRAARHGLADWLRGLDADPEMIEDIQLAVSELAANAIEASPDGCADIQASLIDRRVRVVVSNQAPEPFSWNSSAAPPADSVSGRGRGLKIAAGLGDSVEVITAGGRTEATFIRGLSAG